MTIRLPTAMSLSALVLSACAGPVTQAPGPATPLPGTTELAVDEAPHAAPQPAPPPEEPSVDLSRPPLATDVEGAIVLDRALGGSGPRIVVSRGERYLWLLDGERVVFAARVAVGRDTIFRYQDREWDFSTPRGVRTVRDKEPVPIWVPPDWHYLELAAERGLEPVRLEPGSVFRLADGSRIEVRGDQVGRVNQYGNFRPFRPGTEIIFDGFVFIPPFGSAQRQVPEVLGTHRLILGDGYLIHGTPDEDSIGEGASHGCVRMRNADVEQLYALVEVGTPVYIY
ncbi:MAG: L,D-transpeptidase [Gemmatimonadetes bacterium]|nr:L,D-transpeptidase [Gemmatimonadota bacterium]